jgi:hypothetical protein
MPRNRLFNGQLPGTLARIIPHRHIYVIYNLEADYPDASAGNAFFGGGLFDGCIFA